MGPQKAAGRDQDKTRSWRDAEQIAQAYRDRHDPDEVRAAKAEAALKNKQQAESAVATIEEGVAKFLVFE